MSSQEFSFTWSDHHRSVVEVFGRYLAEETLVDCTIAAEGECLKAHKLVLAACSTYFELLFSQETYKGKLVVLENVKFKDLQFLIAYMYKGQVTIPKDRLWDCIKAAELLQIRGLPRDLVLNPLREASEMSVECRKEALASQLSHEWMYSSEENVYLQPEYFQESHPTKEIAVFPADKEASVEPKEEVDVEDTPIWDSEDENTCTVTDVSLATAGEVVRNATVSADNCQSVVWPNGTFRALASACVETQRVSKEVHSLEINEETAKDECIAGECTNIDVIDSTVDKVVESGLSVVEIDEDYAIKEEHVMEGQEIVGTVERTLDADVVVKKSEVEKVDSVPLSERISKMLQRQSHRCLKSASVFDSVNDLRLHGRNTHKKKISKSCDVCKATFASGTQLIMHMRKHTNERPFKCDICSRAFSQRCSLIRHIRAHSGEGLFQCELCERSFSDRSAFANHERTHTGERPFKCNVCSASFSRESCLNVHKRIHTGERPFHCEVCERSFCGRSALGNHERTHTGERPFKCDVCSVSFCQSTHLNRHKLIHTGERPFQCEECERSFRNTTALAEHKRTHTGERPFKCDVCSVSFNQKGNLNRHKLIHTGERPFQCDVCERSFRQRTKLVEHKRTHTGERPFKCDICKTAFGVKSSLIKHMCTHAGDGCFQCDIPV